MKVGVNILNFGPGASPSNLLRWARISEDLGYHSVMICDHVAVTEDVSPRYPEPFFDPFTSLTWLAGQTRNIKIGTTVIVLPYRNPLLMARLVANIDHLSGGRFIFGVGIGNAKLEFQALGIAHEKRGAIGNEYLSAMKALWTEDMASFNGKHVSFDQVYGPKPLQMPYPPIWVGGNSDGALRRAVKHGDAWHPILSTHAKLTNEDMPRLKQIAEKMERPVPAFCPRIRLQIGDTSLPEGERIVGNGTLDQVRSDLERLHSMGAEHVILDRYTGNPTDTIYHEYGWEMLATLANKVLDLRKESLR